MTFRSCSLIAVHVSALAFALALGVACDASDSDADSMLTAVSGATSTASTAVPPLDPSASGGAGAPALTLDPLPTAPLPEPSAQPSATPATPTVNPPDETGSIEADAAAPMGTVDRAPDAGAGAAPSVPDAGFGGDTGTDGACAPFVMPSDCTIPEGAVLPSELRCTGLYEDWASRTLGCGVRGYAPAYALWSDGAEKYRYVWLPPDTTVDVTDPDDFRYPVGTQFWKEFRVPDGDGFRLGETRLMRKVAAGWLYTSYVWSEDGTTAVQNNDGVTDLFGSGHSVPAREQCKECHSGRPDFILGWDALMLGEGATGITRDDLSNEGLVTWSDREAGAPNPLELAIPGDEIEKAALGYLHANCGVSCHNDSTRALALETGFFTRLDHEALGSVVQTPAFSTGLGRLPSPNAPLSDLTPPSSGEFVDLMPLDTERSLVLVRMQIRDNDAAMPRMGTNRVDEDGVAIVRQWIESMTPERGYPAQ